jgi:hypothetical protein
MAEAADPEALNNRAWRLAEKTSRTKAEDQEMLDAANAVAGHWGKAGDELERARAAILLGQVHALLGDGKRALQYAREAFAYVTEQEDMPGWQVAIAHAVMANAAAANDERSLQKTHYQRAKTLGSALTDDDERALFEATFRTVPEPD